MKTFQTRSFTKPDYYDTFACLADKCSFTCCQEWKIAVDENTLNNWQSLPERPDRDTAVVEGTCVMRLNSNHKCQYLNEQNLCRLVLKYGDSVLSDTCDSFPRQMHHFTNYTEFSLATSCPEVIDYLWNQQTVKLVSVNPEEALSYMSASQRRLYQLRGRLLDLMEINDMSCHSLQENLLAQFYMLLHADSIHEIKTEDLFAAFSSMEFNLTNSFYERNELFLDLIESYQQKGMYRNFLDGTSHLAQEIASNWSDEKMYKKALAFEEELEPYKRLLCRYIYMEIYSCSLLPEFKLNDMIYAFQWIAIEYALLRHGLFLQWEQNHEKTFSYETVRESIIILSRICGYDESDIQEYLKNNFKSALWDWSYLALIVGMPPQQ